MKQTKELTIDGMTCGNCIRHVTSALNSVDGIEVKEVGLGLARISYDESQVTEDRVLAAVQEAGYHARVNE